MSFRMYISAELGDRADDCTANHCTNACQSSITDIYSLAERRLITTEDEAPFARLRRKLRLGTRNICAQL